MKNKKNQILISIIIVNFNSHQLLDSCIKAIYKQKISLEIIIIDNNPDKKSTRLFRNRYSSIRIIENQQNLGFAKAVNQAIKLTQGKYVLSLNPDMILGKNYISTLIKILEKNHQIGAVQGKIITYTNQRSTYNYGLLFNYWGILNNTKSMPKHRNNQYGKVFSVQVPIVRKSLFNIIGGYDKHYWLYYEDVDFSWKIWHCGLQVTVCPNVSIYHNHVKSEPINSINQLTLYQHATYNCLYTYLKNYEFPNMIKACIVRLIISFVSFFIYIFKGKYNYGLIYIKAWIKIFQNLSYIIQKRKQIQSQRKISDKQIYEQSGGKLNLANISNNIRYIL